MAALSTAVLAAMAVPLVILAHGAHDGLDTVGGPRRALRGFWSPVSPLSPIPINITVEKEVFGKDGLVVSLNVTGTLHGPNGTNSITETDVLTLGGPNHFNKTHNEDVMVTPKQLKFGGGEDYASGDHNATAGYGGGATFNKNRTFDIGGGGGATIKDFNIGAGGGASKGPAENDTGSQYYSPYVPPHAP